MVQEYLSAIKKLNLLSSLEEEELWIKYKENKQSQARQRLIESYQPLVFKLVKQVSTNQNNFMDLIQEGNIGLIDAVDSYDHKKGIRFSSYAIYRIKGRILNHLQEGKLNYTGIEGDLVTINQSTEEEVEDNLLLDRVRKHITELSASEQQVINGMYLTNKGAKALAEEMDISLSYLYRLQKKAVRRLRGKLSTFISKWSG